MAKLKSDCGILGTGKVALTLAVLAARSGHNIRLWNPEKTPAKDQPPLTETLKELDGRKLPASLTLTTDLSEACKNAALLLVALPGFELRNVIRKVGEHLSGDQVMVHAINAIEFDGESIKRISEMIREETCIRKIGMVAGPFFPEEILTGQPSAMVVASPFKEVVDITRNLMSSANFQLFSSADMTGVELAGAMTDIYAIAGGIASGLGYGLVTRSFITTRALAEMSRLGVVCGAKADTFSGLSGLGTLLVSMAGEKSLSFRLGYKLGKASKAAKAAATGDYSKDVFNSLKAASSFARRMRIQMPILFSVHQILSGKRSPKNMTKKLIAGQVGTEIDVTIDYTALNLPIPTVAPKGGGGKG